MQMESSWSRVRALYEIAADWQTTQSATQELCVGGHLHRDGAGGEIRTPTSVKLTAP